MNKNLNIIDTIRCTNEDMCDFIVNQIKHKSEFCDKYDKIIVEENNGIFYITIYGKFNEK